MSISAKIEGSGELRLHWDDLWVAITPPYSSEQLNHAIGLMIDKKTDFARDKLSRVAYEALSKVGTIRHV